MTEPWLERAQDVGLIGPASLRFHRAHALGFLASDELRDLCLSAEVNGLDLGSGGGLPGLVLAQEYPTMSWTLLDSRKRSVSHLQQAVAETGLAARVEVVAGRGEELAQSLTLRERFRVVTARGFGPPAATAEIGSGFVAVGGSMVVSEPPDGGKGRWDASVMATLGLEHAEVWSTEDGHYRRFTKVDSLDGRFPRRTGVPKKRPLF